MGVVFRVQVLSLSRVHNVRFIIVLNDCFLLDCVNMIIDVSQVTL